MVSSRNISCNESQSEIPKPAWQRAVKDDSIEGIRRGRHRRQAPASMQRDAATWSSWLKENSRNIIQVLKDSLPQSISGYEKEEELRGETRLHNPSNPIAWTRQWWSLSTRTPDFKFHQKCSPSTFSADWAMGPKVFQMAHCSIVKSEKRVRIHHLCQWTRTCPVSRETIDKSPVIFPSVECVWNKSISMIKR